MTFVESRLSPAINIHRYGMCRQFSRLASAEKYDQLTGCWESIASLNEPRSGVGVVAIGRKMYALGGFDGKNYLK